MTVDAKVHRRRTIRRHILRMLRAAHVGNPDVGIEFAEICKAFTGGQTNYDREEIQAELIDLLDDGLIKSKPSPFDAMVRIYEISSRGRDFLDADCPWDRIDEFTGKQGFGI